MTTFNTGNSIGSTDARDLSDNAENFDVALGTLSPTWVDRLGNVRDSFEGRLAKGSFYRVGTFSAGYTLTNMRQTLEYSGVEYSWAGSFPKVISAGATPATSGGIGAGAWVDRTQETVRSDLEGGGSLGSAYKTIIVDLPPFNGDLDAAINSVSGYTNFILGQKTYYSTLFSGANRNNKIGLKFYGAGVPVFDAAAKVLTEYTGTIIRGSIQNSAKGFEVHNLGIDLSDTVRTAYRGGVYEDALVNYNFGDNAGIKYGNLIILESEAIDGNAATYTHCHLAEIGSGVEVTGNLEIIYGGHGYVIKCQDFNAAGKTIKCYGQRLDSHIVKSDAAAKVKNVHLGNVICGKDGYTTRPGFIEAHTSNSTDDVFYDSLTGSHNEGLLQGSAGSTGYITNVHIPILSNTVSYGSRFNVEVPALAVDWHIGSHEINQCSGGILVHDSAVNVQLGDGIVKGSTTHGYQLGGDYTHGNLIAEDNSWCGVNRTSGYGFNVDRVSGTNNSSGLYSSIPQAAPALVNGWAAQAGYDFSIDVVGRTIFIRGRLSTALATAGSVAVIASGFRPLSPTSILASGALAAGGAVPILCEVTTDGRIEFGVGYRAATGGVIDVNGSYTI